MKRLAFLLFFLCALWLPVRAETDAEAWYREQLQASGAAHIVQSLPAETQQLLERFGVVGWQQGQASDLGLADTVDTLGALLSQTAGGPLSAAAVLMATALLCGWLQGLRHTVGGEKTGQALQFLCDLAVCACLLVPLFACVRRTAAALESVSVFMIAFLPMFGGILLTAGQAVTSAAYQTVLLAAAQGISLLAGQVLLPLMSVSLVCGSSGALSSQTQLHRIGEGVNKAVAWVVGLSASLFTGILSVKSLLGSAADSLGNRAVRFSLGSLVPVVGGSLGEAFGAIRNCLHLLSSSVGAFGIIATAGIVLPPLLQCIAWSAVLSVCGWTAQVMDVPMLSQLLHSGRSVVRTLIALLCACALVMMVSTAVVTSVRAGV